VTCIPRLGAIRSEVAAGLIAQWLKIDCGYALYAWGSQLEKARKQAAKYADIPAFSLVNLGVDYAGLVDTVHSRRLSPLALDDA
jgi:hypothetical protein